VFQDVYATSVITLTVHQRKHTSANGVRTVPTNYMEKLNDKIK